MHNVSKLIKCHWSSEQMLAHKKMLLCLNRIWPRVLILLPRMNPSTRFKLQKPVS